MVSPKSAYPNADVGFHTETDHVRIFSRNFSPILLSFREFGYLRDYPSTPKAEPRFGANLTVDGFFDKEFTKDDESIDNESGIGRSRAGNQRAQK